MKTELTPEQRKKAAEHVRQAGKNCMNLARHHKERIQQFPHGRVYFMQLVDLLTFNGRKHFARAAAIEKGELDG